MSYLINSYPLNKILASDILENSIILGKWGCTLPIIHNNDKLIRLHNPRSKITSEYKWYSNWKDLVPNIEYKKIIILEKELNITNIEVSQLNIWSQWGINRNTNPSIEWLTKIKKLTAKRQSHKHALDTNMYQGIVPLPQEVYTLYENRPDRNIVVFDIKSAYPSTITNIEMPDPASLRYVPPDNIHAVWNDNTYSGLYRVILKLKKDAPEWFREWHPLVLTKDMQSYKFYFPENKTLITWMHSNEKEAWSKFLDITPIDGIIGKKHRHPLANIVEQLLEIRSHTENPIDDAQLKWLLSRIHSTSTMKVLKYTNKKESNEWFNLIGSQPTEKHNHVKLANNSWFIPDIANVHNVYTWNSAITCYLRGYWLSFLTQIMKTDPLALLCYANIDSMHISFNTNTLDDTLNELEIKGYTGKLPGKWEIKHIANKGLWLSTNKYWLIKDDIIVKTIMNGEKWKLKDEKHMLRKGYLKLWRKSLWHSLTSSKNTKYSSKNLILQKRRPLPVILNTAELRKQWNFETLKSRNWKKRLWYKTRKPIL